MFDGEGNDAFMRGGEDNDFLIGDAGDDEMFDGPGKDQMVGDQSRIVVGNDFLDGVDGVVNNDVLDGTAGIDTCLSDPDFERECELPP
jgi:Ca2+-binding RTX toxin-like protein